MTIASINPATNETIETFHGMAKDKVMEAIATAHNAYHSWRKLSYEVSYEDRKKQQLKFAKQLRADANTYRSADQPRHGQADQR